jgi:hypothetical protein
MSVSDPAAFEAVRLTLYVPGLVYVWLGFWALELVPSPKSQLQLVGLSVELSLKETASGALPLVGLALKSAVGAVVGTATVM